MQGLGLHDAPKDVPKSDAPKKISGGLVVASCAAVLTVYAAGHVRTQDAADRLAAQIAKRRATVSTPQQAHLSIKDSAAFRDPEHEEHGNHRKPVVEVPLPLPPLPKPPVGAMSKGETFSEGVTASKEVLPDSVTAPPVKTAILIAPAISVEGATPVPAPAAAPATSFLAPLAPAPAAAAVPDQVWKDGSYSGWGYSRHGNIEATVVIEGGRILSAVISQCRTRYSCSVIDRLPPQVAQRQSPDVDYVSGATQSADAFYGAVVEALNKAK
jgi:uncharacterized protein with FMN-binding domain